MQTNKSIAFQAGGVDACALWRAWIPYMNLRNSGYYYAFNISTVLTHDYVMVQRLGLQSNLDAMKQLRSANVKIIYDLDDFLWDVPDWNPHKALLEKAKHGYSVCLQHADLVTVSTNPLRKALLKHHNRDLRNTITGKEIPVVVVPNRIDMRFVAMPQKREEFIVGWAGSNTHKTDFDHAMPALKQLIPEYPQVTWEFAGWIPEELQKFPNVRFRAWTPVSEWFTRFPRWGWSIALAPLDGHEFNQAKSGNKMTEAGAISIPCLASYESPYSDWCATAGDRAPQLREGLLAVTQGAWYTKLKRLLDEPEYRDFMGRLMHENTVEHHSWQGRGWGTGWADVFPLMETL